MNKLIFALALIGAPAVPAHAQGLKETFTYVCTEKGRPHTLKLDGARRAFIWKGKTYKTTELDAGADSNPCPRFGWHVEGNGEAFEFCTATKGFGSFNNVECRQRNP